MAISRFGYVTLVGAPNIGKSTLLNQLIGLPISIVNKKSHTTRRQILGVFNHNVSQVVMLDTPGYQELTRAYDYKLMRREINAALDGSDLILYLIDLRTDLDIVEKVYRRLNEFSSNIFIIINKIDRIRDKSKLLGYSEKLSSLVDFKKVYFISALKNDGLKDLKDTIADFLPEGKAQFNKDYQTNLSLSERAQEEIRNAILNCLHEEVPYGIEIQINNIKKDKDLVIHADLVTKKKSYKSMIIGKDARTIKAIGTQARNNIEKWCGTKCSLFLKVNQAK